MGISTDRLNSVGLGDSTNDDADQKPTAEGVSSGSKTSHCRTEGGPNLETTHRPGRSGVEDVFSGITREWRCW